MKNKKHFFIKLLIVSGFIAAAIGLSFLWKSKSESNALPITKKTLESDISLSNPKIKETENFKNKKASSHVDGNSNIASDDNGAKEIIMNSADAPSKVEAPEIKLDENDNPIVNAEGAPLLK